MPAVVQRQPVQVLVAPAALGRSAPAPAPAAPAPAPAVGPQQELHKLGHNKNLKLDVTCGKWNLCKVLSSLEIAIELKCDTGLNFLSRITSHLCNYISESYRPFRLKLKVIHDVSIKFIHLYISTHVFLSAVPAVGGPAVAGKYGAEAWPMSPPPATMPPAMPGPSHTSRAGNMPQAMPGPSHQKLVIDIENQDNPDSESDDDDDQKLVIDLDNHDTCNDPMDMVRENMAAEWGEVVSDEASSSPETLPYFRARLLASKKRWLQYHL